MDLCHPCCVESHCSASRVVHTPYDGDLTIMLAAKLTTESPTFLLFKNDDTERSLHDLVDLKIHQNFYNDTKTYQTVNNLSIIIISIISMT